MRPLIAIVLFAFICGCQTAPKKTAQEESQQQVISALGTVTQGLTNQNVSEKDLKNLAVQLQKDPSAQAAVQSVNNALSVQQTNVMFCPKCGRRFSDRFKYCPFDKTALKPVE